MSLGQNSGPAQRPDCNRYMEALFIKLCEQYPCNVRKNATILCWSLIIAAYKKIRDHVITNHLVTKNTNVQLVDIMALHCRRKTRGAEETSVLLHKLFDTFCGEQGNDTLGVPLLDSEKTMEMWEVQQKHVECIQDPENIQLYTQTRTLVACSQTFSAKIHSKNKKINN